MRSLRCLRWLAFAVISCALVTTALAQQKNDPPKTDPQPIPRLTIEVTGGDGNKPIENASVYVKTEEEHLLKDKKLELNVKTNMNGIAHVPDPPTGRVLIQIVADGWKPYGRWYEITDAKEHIKIHLDRPPKWY